MNNPPNKTQQEAELKQAYVEHLRALADNELSTIEDLTGRALLIEEMPGTSRLRVCWKPEAGPGQPAEEFESISRSCPNRREHSGQECRDIYTLLLCAFAVRRSMELFLDSPQFRELALEVVAREI